jgi:hypothetical protein
VTPKKRGRPPVIVGERRRQLLHILRRGQSRELAAERVGIDPATVARTIRRDPQFRNEVAAAEQEGDKFLAIYDKLLGGVETVLERHPVISTPELEREKEYLISCGCDPKRIRRLRLRELEDGPPPPPEHGDEEHRVNSGIKVKPWRRPRRK